MEMIGNLAGGIAHDFNNVLVGITGPLSILKRDLNKPDGMSKEETREYLDMIGESGIRASKLVQQLLGLGRKHDLKMMPVDLRDSITNIVNVCKSSFDKSVHIQYNTMDSTAVTLADETQIEQCLLNLCVNAAHAMTLMKKDKDLYGGELIVSLSPFYADRNFTERHGCIQPGNFFKISIQDTGIGIETDDLSKIFDPFFTTKAKGEGSGLGLSMVYNIISEHRGLVTVYSEPGIGTTVNVFLPQDEKDSLAKSVFNHDQIIKGSGTILVVDDEELMRITTSKILEEAGYVVVTVEDGPEALELFQKQYSEFTMVIIDMAMPEMYGDELYKKLKAIDPSVKVLLASGFSQDQRAIKILAEGVNGFLQKPFTMYGLTKAVSDIIARG